jgi:hypothetical protein
MGDLSGVSKRELMFDRQESFNDLAVLAIAKLSGIKHYKDGTVDERIRSNLRIIEVIGQECERRGFDPAQFRQERD